MSQIIAGVYEIAQQIGAGGNGIVYLGRHLRLGKLVAIKADKRMLSAKPEVLRREVDALKNLSHTYIPQVYDFVQENGMVYTVMDYIEGESLDRPLKRNEHFSQAQVVEWGIQILEALCYLHSRPPYGILHSDIKPANIMLTSQNNICLIDFNIALALGEEGAVRVGYSQGYASPEHYGIDLKNRCTAVNDETSVMSCADSSNKASGHGGMLLDVRSDIYSLGATLYHLLTGVKPAIMSDEVIPISNYVGISKAVADIIEKAMRTNPDERFQTSDEMLQAFENLHKNDVRTKYYRRICTATAAALTTFFLLGGFTAFVGLNQMERREKAYTLAEYSANALKDGDIEGAIKNALKALPEKRGLFDPPYTPQAQRALTEAVGVYDVSDGFKSHSLIHTSSEPIKTALSPDGKSAAVMMSGEAVIFDTESGEKTADFKMNSSALSDIIFADDNTILYAGEDALTAYDLKNDSILWKGTQATGIALSADGNIAASVYRDENTAFIYDMNSGNIISRIDFGDKKRLAIANDIFADPDNDIFALDRSGNWLAVSFSDGSISLFDTHGNNNWEIYADSEYKSFSGGFFGKYFAFSAYNSEKSVFAVLDTECRQQTGGFLGKNPFYTLADESGIYVCTENIIVNLNPITGEQTEKAYINADVFKFSINENYTIASDSDGTLFLFDENAVLLKKYEGRGRSDFILMAEDTLVTANRDEATLSIMKEKKYAENHVFSYDADYRHDEVRINADGQKIMLFRFDSFRIYDIGGKLINETAITNSAQVYDQQYIRDVYGSYLDVTYNDGTICRYSAETGEELYRRQGIIPDRSLHQEFFTDSLRISAPLHGIPVAYDKVSGEKIKELESNDYLTYVTQLGNNIIAEYITSYGYRYGLLMNKNCEVLADLPMLCDISEDGKLFFDDKCGNIRKTRIYTLQELIAAADSVLQI